MTSSITNRSRFIAFAVGVALVTALLFGGFIPSAQAALTEAQIQSILSLLSSFGADQSTINNVNASLRGQPTTTPPPSGGACPALSRDLKQGSSGADVKALQVFLNGSATTRLASSGAGSPGLESTYFGPITHAAVLKFQSANNVAPVAGYVGPITRAAIAAVCGGTTPAPGPTPSPTTGTGLTIGAAAQPANSLAPDLAARIPFTRFTVTASNDGDVTLNSVTVERQGLAADAVFSGVMLLDENGVQIGITKTLNSNHQATVGEPVTIPRGTTRTFTVAANRADTSTHAGEIASFAVIAVNTSATVNGALPITGASHTINEALAIGTATAARGSTDPGSNQTKEVGTKAYTFSSIRLTAGSAEKLYLKSIRWNQTGSASFANDLANVKTIVDGTEYGVTSSADGKYFTTLFPGNGILIDKGFNKDVSIKGDIINGSARTIDFDIAKRTDINLVGENFGFGVLAGFASSAAAADSSNVNNADDPYYDASQVTISTGSMTVSTWNGVAAQNVAINQSNQVFAGFSVDVKGEAISVGSLVFRLTTIESSGAAVTFDDVDSVSLVDANGAVLAGPVDATDGGVDAVNALVTFTDTITFPTGVTNMRLQGKLTTDFDTNDTIAASTTPSANWTTVTGQVTGNTITPSPTSALTGPTMTVKSGALTVSVSSVPIAQTAIAGSNGFEFARYIFDATGSGEDLRLSTIPLYFDTSGTRTDLTNCFLYNGTTVITDVKNPATADTASSTSFTFTGGGLILTKGTSNTLSLKCNIRSGATGGFWWGIDAGQNASYTGASGVTSGQTVTETFTDASGQIMTLASGGSLSVILDTNSPGYKIASAGSTGVELARIKFSATNEDVDLRQFALQFSDVASNTPVNLVNREVKLYDGTMTLIGTAVFPTGDNATSSTIVGSTFRVPRDGSNVLIIKGDIAGISQSGPMTRSGDLLTVDYDTDNESGTNGTYGVGGSSGSNVVPSTSSDTDVSGVRIMRGYPVLSWIDIPTTSKTLSSGADKTLYRFSVTATDNDVALYKFTFSVASSTGSVSSATTSVYGLYAYTNSSYSSADTTFSSTGLLNASNFINGLGVNADAVGDAQRPSVIETYMDKASATTTYIVPKGATRWFELRTTLSGVETVTGSESIDVSLLGDAAFPVNTPDLMSLPGAGTGGVDADTNDDFIWSPVSTTTQNLITDLDFTNGYQANGLPGVNMTAVTITSIN